MATGSVVRLMPRPRSVADAQEAARPLGVITPASLSRVIDQEVVSRPFTTWDRGISGIITNRDPVLQFMAPAANSSYYDERVYETMLYNEHKIPSARDHLDTEVFSEDFEVQPGPSADGDAKRFRDFAEALWMRIPQRHEVLARMLDAHYFGWSPLQVVIDREAKFEGKTTWMPKRIINKPHHMVRFTERGSVAWLPEHYSGSALEFSGTDAALGWMTPSVGNLNHPYGAGKFGKIWMLYYTKRQIFRRFQVGFDRQYGLIKLTSSETGKLQDTIKEVGAELAAMLEYLTAHNILLQTAGWTSEMLSCSDFLSAGLDVIKYLDDELHVGICGEVLTSNPGDRGTQALGTVHRAVKNDYALAAMRGSIEQPMTDLFRMWIEANFGPQEPRSLPIFISRLRLRPSPEAVTTYLDYGGKVKARRLATLWGLETVAAFGDEEADEPLLAKPEQVVAAPGGTKPGSDAQDAEEDDAVSTKDTPRAVERQNALFERALSAAMAQAEPALTRRATQLADDFARENDLLDPQ